MTKEEIEKEWNKCAEESNHRQRQAAENLNEIQGLNGRMKLLKEMYDKEVAKVEVMPDQSKKPEPKPESPAPSENKEKAAEAPVPLIT